MPAPIIEAHRGARAEAPENTLAAFQLALDLKVDSIELDVHPAADGTLVVIHDDTVDRTTNGTGAVAAMPLGDLRKLDAGLKFHDRFAGERIPTLDEVLARVAPTPTTLNIEIKQPPPGMKVAEGVVERLRRHGKADRYMVSSFDIDALLAVRRLAPEVALALIGEPPEVLASARELTLPWIHCNQPSLTAALLSQAHGSGILVGVWTVNDPVAVRHWATLGVNRIITDNPRAMLALGLF
jgi:glycerophosphoryl diester phosphodiesterase